MPHARAVCTACMAPCCMRHACGMHAPCMCSHLAARTVQLPGEQRVHCLRIWPPLQLRSERLLQHPQLRRLFPQLLRRSRCRLLTGSHNRWPRHRHICIRSRRRHRHTSRQLEPLGEASLLRLQLVHTSCRGAHLAQQQALRLGQPVEATERHLMRPCQRVQLVAEARQRQCWLVPRPPSDTGASASATASGSTSALESVQLVFTERVTFHCAPRCATGRSLVPLGQTHHRSWLCRAPPGRPSAHRSLHTCCGAVAIRVVRHPNVIAQTTRGLDTERGRQGTTLIYIYAPEGCQHGTHLHIKVSLKFK